MNLTIPAIVTASDWTYPVLRREIQTGDLIRLRRGCYLARTDEDIPAWQQRQRSVLARCAAVAHSYRSEFAFSHATAALLHGWDVNLHDDTVTITQPVNPSGRQMPDVRRLVRSDLTPQQLVSIAGLTVTSQVRTLLDCARFLAPRDSLVIVDSALRTLARMSRFNRAESVSRQELLRDELTSHLNTLGRVPGVVRARAVLALADGFSESPGESQVRWIALSHGLPQPICQLPVAVDGRSFYPDLTWRLQTSAGLQMVNCEFDGAIKYRGEQGAAAVATEKAREDLLRNRCGAYFLRITWPQLGNPIALFRSLAATFPANTLPKLEPRRVLLTRPRRSSGTVS